MDRSNRIFLGLESPLSQRNLTLASLAQGLVRGVRISDAAWDAAGYEGGGTRLFVRALRRMGHEVWLDRQVYNRPSVTGRTIRNLANLFRDFEDGDTSITYVSVHATGGKRMLEEAVRAAEAIKIIGITALTSTDEDNHLFRPILPQYVGDLADLAEEPGIGLYGVTCPAPFVRKIRRSHEKLTIFVPGIRLEGYDGTEQGDSHNPAYTVSPARAIELGADFLCVGQPVHDAASPDEAVGVLRHINEEVAEALEKIEFVA